jgi:hypothetical protein
MNLLGARARLAYGRHIWRRAARAMCLPRLKRRYRRRVTDLCTRFAFAATTSEKVIHARAASLFGEKILRFV